MSAESFLSYRRRRRPTFFSAGLFERERQDRERIDLRQRNQNGNLKLMTTWLQRSVLFMVLTNQMLTVIYATADEADAYMFYRWFFLFFCFFLFFFRPSQKYRTTVLGNG